MRRILQWALAALVAAALAQAIWQQGHLPARVATHFDFSGRPNGWMSREVHLKYQTGLVVGLAAVMVGLGWLIPKLPGDLVNVPHRDRWLAPERREATYAWLANLLLVTACFLEAFFMALFNAMYRANLSPERRLTLSPVLTVALPVGFLVGLAVVTWWRFSRRQA